MSQGAQSQSQAHNLDEHSRHIHPHAVVNIKIVVVNHHKSFIAVMLRVRLIVAQTQAQTQAPPLAQDDGRVRVLHCTPSS